jgi:hypothetical protein
MPMSSAVRILRENGASGVLVKGAQQLRVRALRLASDYHRQNVRRWAALKGLYSGRRAFLIGNGPSLNQTPLHLLEGEETLCFNRFNIMFERLTWRPTMYMNVDPLVATDMADEIDEIADQVRYAFLPDYHYEGGDYFRGRIRDRESMYWMYHTLPGFHRKLPSYWGGGTVAFAGLQVLAFLGFDPIYLVGVDMSYRLHTTARDTGRGGIVSTCDDDPNHFDARYFGQGRNYHQPHSEAIAMMDRAFARAARYATAAGRRILNAGIGGALEHFPRVQLRQVLAIPESEERRRVDAAVRRAAGTGLDEFLSQAHEMRSVETWNAESRFVVADEGPGLAIVKQALFTHIPIGPFDGKYFFVRREGSQGEKASP